MTSVYSLPDPEVIESEACAWLAQVDGGNMSPGDLAALKEWIGRSPHHKRTFERMASEFIALGTPPAALARLADVAAAPPAKPPRWQGWATAVAAATVLILGLALAVPLLLQQTGAQAVQSYVAKLGEQRAVTLADGSQLLLNTDTHVKIRMTDRERAVELVRGEALFTVAKDVQRPFRVYTQQGVVRAVGTVFSVRLRRAEIEVVVAEGAVELARGDVSAGTQADALEAVTRVVSGKRAAFSLQNHVVSDLDAATMDRRLSWREGLLVFDSDPLAYVVDEVSRYTDIEIVISDPRIMAMPIGGNFRVGETQALLDALEKGFGISVRRVGDRLVYLSARS
ncbi:MAG: FecR family protein [Sphingomonadales bacterium]